MEKTVKMLPICKFLNKKQLRLLKRSLSHREILSKHFNIPQIDRYIRKYKLETIDPENIEKSLEYCKKIGFSNESILDNLKLLKTNHVTLTHRHKLLEEGGFFDITARTLLKFQFLVKLRISELKLLNFIKPTTNVADSLISHLNPRQANYSISYKDEINSWLEVYKKIFNDYLKWRLEIDEEAVTHLFYTPKYNLFRSFRLLCENIKIAEDLGYTRRKIARNSYLLKNLPDYTKTTLEKYPNLAGSNMRHQMLLYPKLVTTSPTNIAKIHDILKKHNIPDEFIQKSMNVYHMSPDTVEFRLNELQKISDFKVLNNNPRVLQLVVHHNRAKSRLSFMKELHFKCSGMRILGSDDDAFDTYVKQGRDINKPTDINAFLKGLFKRELEEFEERLRRHPNYLQVPLVRMEETYHHLRGLNFSKNAIFHVIYILLYPKQKIDFVLNEMDKTKGIHKNKFNQAKILDLIVYFIEKEHHFTGNGIWLKDEIVTDEIPSEN